MVNVAGNKIKKIVYIVDGGFKIGLGHVYQSIAFAKVLARLAEVCFLTKSEENIVNKIKDAGFLTFRLSDDSEIFNFLKEDTLDIVIFDKIDVSEELAKRIKEESKIKLVIFTNLTDANRYAHIAVTAGIGSNFKNIRYVDEQTNTLYFYGPKYWIMRDEFHEIHRRKKDLPKIARNILVIFGGSDPANLTTMVVKELFRLPASYKIDVILGASFGHIDSLNQVLEEYKLANRAVKIHQDVSNVAELMYEADLVITSPGLSTFEALYVGTPILLLPQYLLQKETYEGYFKMIDPEDITSLLNNIVNMDFTYPDQEDIIQMNIADGAEELINVILED